MSLENVNSQVRFNDYGVPQGSILGPVLFLLCINDLPDAALSGPILFADDKYLQLHDLKPESLQIKLNHEIFLVQKCCNTNKPTINSRRCHTLLILPKMNECIQEFTVSLKDTSISTEKSVKY